MVAAPGTCSTHGKAAFRADRCTPHPPPPRSLRPITPLNPDSLERPVGDTVHVRLPEHALEGRQLRLRSAGLAGGAPRRGSLAAWRGAVVSFFAVLELPHQGGAALGHTATGGRPTHGHV